MHPIRRILVAIKDPSAETLPAVAKAARIARACGAHLELFHAMKVSVYSDKPATYEEAFQNLYTTQRRTYLQRLGRIAARLKLHDIDVSTAVECDYPTYEVIIRRATQTKADLIVVRQHDGRHAMPGFLRLTDWELLRYSPVPVLLVKRSAPYRHPTILAAVDPCHAHAKPAQLDEQILTAASQLASTLQGKLHAVHAYAPVVIRGAAGSVHTSVGSRLDEAAAANAQVSFEELLKGSDIPRTRRHVLRGLPAPAINATARRIRAKIVVMGALSRSGLKRLFFGNTAESLLGRLPCDILVVKPTQVTTRRRNAPFKGDLTSEAGARRME
jgi:universal stress protein E